MAIERTVKRVGLAGRALGLALVVCLAGLVSFADFGVANPLVPPSQKTGPAALPPDLESQCVAAFETPVVETYVQGWQRRQLQMRDCLGTPLTGRDAARALRALPARGPIKVEAINWDKGLYGIRLDGRLVYVSEDDTVRIGIERRAVTATKSNVRGLVEPPPVAPVGGPEPQDKRLHQVRVFYGTNRQIVAATPLQADARTIAPIRYGALKGEVSYGTALVTLPPRHERGELERPAWWRLEFSADPENHVTFKAAIPAQSREAFLQDVRALVAASGEKQAFVFVHGFNTGFEAAALRTAQMHHDLGFDGAPIFWSWASKGRPDPVAYFADTRAAAQTVDDLTAFLQMVALETGATRVHVIAHSMGNQATLRALDKIAQSSAPARALFDQIVLCSPDVDRAEFERVAQAISGTAKRTTLYASANDKALGVSAILNGGRRLGDATGGVVTRPGLESVDASKVTTDLFSLNHTFFSSVPSVMGDLKIVLSSPALPLERGLVEVRPQAPNMDAQRLPWWAIP
jgi:esterase/lipase superfamily enzyme